jgi:enoyl-CoA hydratase
MNNSFVRQSIEAGVSTITIDRQDKLNALNKQVISELDSAFRTAAGSAEARCVVLTGAGPKAFVAGADIGELRALDSDGVTETVNQGHELMNLIENLEKPVIAAVNGFALGGGCELALACHLRIASDNAQLGLPEVHLGLMPGYGGTQRLGRLIGRGRALELMLTGKPVKADRALEIGLVNMVTVAEELESAVKSLASKFAKSAPCAMKSILQAVNEGADIELKEALTLEASLFTGLFETDDMREGTAAFLEKRKPEFKGR